MRSRVPCKSSTRSWMLIVHWPYQWRRSIAGLPLVGQVEMARRFTRPRLRAGARVGLLVEERGAFAQHRDRVAQRRQFDAGGGERLEAVGEGGDLPAGGGVFGPALGQRV